MRLDVLTKEIFAQYNDGDTTHVSMSDSIGNSLHIFYNGKVFLNIPSEGKRIRDIGYIRDDTFFVSREQNHVFRKNNSFGFNYNLLKYTELFNFVNIKYEGRIYKIPKGTILNLGKIMNFKNASDGNSFELQIFMPINIISHYKTELCQLPLTTPSTTEE